MTSSVNKRVTRNALALTFRMILVTLVGLYTSRVILEVLGVDDYGIYGVIGGVVGIASFLNYSMSGATSRFITFELGRDNEEGVRTIFSNSLMIHLLLAVFVAILAETVGLWFVNYKMNFPPERMLSVNVLYQFTILTMFVSFTQVPYTACILAHEKMNIYAIIEMINVCLKLGVLYIVVLFKTDKLILYAALVFIISTSVAFIYRIYCIKKFKETKVKPSWNKEISRKMLAFSGFDLYGNMCGALKYQGLPIILNIFFGVVANAASTIATAVANAIKNLSSAISQAFRPQIVKRYAAEEIPSMASMMLKANQFTLLAFAAAGIPVFFETKPVLDIWLGQVPQYAVEFLQLILIGAFLEVCIDVNNAGIHATGNVKYISFISGTVYLLCPIISYLLLKFSTFPPSMIYYANIITMGTVAILGWLFLKIQISEFPIKRYVTGIFRILVCIGISIAGVVFCRNFLIKTNSDSGLWLQLLDIAITVIINLILLALTSYFIGFNSLERKSINSAIVNKIRKFRRKSAN